jgi:hypothetical protein
MHITQTTLNLTTCVWILLHTLATLGPQCAVRHNATLVCTKLEQVGTLGINNNEF